VGTIWRHTARYFVVVFDNDIGNDEDDDDEEEDREIQVSPKLLMPSRIQRPPTCHL